VLNRAAATSHLAPQAGRPEGARVDWAGFVRSEVAVVIEQLVYARFGSVEAAGEVVEGVPHLVAVAGIDQSVVVVNDVEIGYEVAGLARRRSGASGSMASITRQARV
jgi:hypothetical protein